MDRKTQIARLENRVAVNPSDFQAVRRLVNLLETEPLKSVPTGRFASADLAIRQTLKGDWYQVLMNPDRFAAKYLTHLKALKQAKIQQSIPVGQVFSGRVHTIQGEHAHCDARLKFFKETSIIPGLCHACYKVQILPETLTAMFQTYFLLLNLELPDDNPRKCMIELRDGIRYPYKAYIYCESVTDAQACLAAFQASQLENGITGIQSKISHGCSEYGVEYPAFKYSDQAAPQASETPAYWAEAEKNYFDKIQLAAPQRKTNTKPYISLRDVLAFRTWVKYAELIGDETSAAVHPAAGPDLPAPFIARVKAQADIRRQERLELIATG